MRIQTEHAGRKKKKRSTVPDRPDYGIYPLSAMEMVRLGTEYVLLDGAVAYLFYRSFLAFLIFLPGAVLYVKERKKELLSNRFSRMRMQFLDGMQFFCTALQAGTAVENAFIETAAELGKLYPPDSFFLQELRYLNAQVRNNTPVETVLTDLGRRSHIEEIRNFAEVFVIAKRTGGDLTAITRNTIQGMQQRQETMQEIETVLAGKGMEQKVMSVVPLAILSYTGLTTPDFLEGVYHTGGGILLMTGCLACYLLAYLWGKRIMDIRC